MQKFIVIYLVACAFVCKVSELYQWAHTQSDHHCVCLFQGMNFIAGYLIIITKDEEKSFWLMDALLGRILPGRPVVINTECTYTQLLLHISSNALHVT